MRRLAAAFGRGRVRESGGKLPHSIGRVVCRIDGILFFSVCLDEARLALIAGVFALIGGLRASEVWYGSADTVTGGASSFRWGGAAAPALPVRGPAVPGGGVPVI